MTIPGIGRELDQNFVLPKVKTVSFKPVVLMAAMSPEAVCSLQYLQCLALRLAYGSHYPQSV